jgi:hypothetical protein
VVVLFGVEDDVTDQFTVFGDNVHVVVHHVETYGLPATFPADIEVSRLTEVATSHARVGRRRRDGRGGRLPTSRARACATSARPGSASTTRNSSEPEPTGNRRPAGPRIAPHPRLRRPLRVRPGRGAPADRRLAASSAGRRDVASLRPIYGCPRSKGSRTAPQRCPTNFVFALSRPSPAPTQMLRHASVGLCFDDPHNPGGYRGATAPVEI